VFKYNSSGVRREQIGKRSEYEEVVKSLRHHVYRLFSPQSHHLVCLTTYPQGENTNVNNSIPRKFTT